MEEYLLDKTDFYNSIALNSKHGQIHFHLNIEHVTGLLIVKMLSEILAHSVKFMPLFV